MAAPLSPAPARAAARAATATDTTRPLRRDAERNKARIVAAASRLYAERGMDVSMDDIAEAAGVGVGTVYRRFPDRSLLVNAIFDQRIDEVIELAEQAAGVADPWSGIVVFMERSTEMEVRNRGLAELIRGVPGHPVAVARARQRIGPVLSGLMTRAREAGLVRTDADATDLAMIKVMVLDLAFKTRDFAPELWRRYLALALDSLKPGPHARPLPAPPLDASRLTAVFERVPRPR